MKIILAAAALAAGMTAAGAASAYQVRDGGITAKEVAEVLQSKGYKAEITTDSVGDPKVRSATDGTDFSILFYGCNKGPRCAAIQFMVGFNLRNGTTYERMNEWNRKNNFGKAYLDDEMDPFLNMTIDTEHGFLTEGLANNLDTWASVMPQFKKFIGWN